MSRIGKKPVFIPSGVTATINGDEIVVKGPKGELKMKVHPHASIALSNVEGADRLDVTVNDPDREDRAIWGTTRALLANMIKGVTDGYQKSLELNGVGFKMSLNGSVLNMSLGFSHDVKYDLIPGVSASIQNNVLTISGISSELVGRTAAEIRALKKPEPYKGKGFRYTDEIIRRKAGKAAKGDK